MLPDILAVGPFMLRTTWLVFLIGFLLGFWLWHRQAKSQLPQKAVKQWENTIFNSVFLFFVIWKFSPLLMQPTILWKAPASLLFITPASWSVLLGVSMAFLYVAIIIYRYKLPLRIVLDLSPFIWGTTATVYCLLIPQLGEATSLPWGMHYRGSEALFHPVHWYQAMIGIVMLVLIWSKKHTWIGTGKAFGTSLVLWGFGGLGISFFKPLSELYVGLTLLQWTYLILILVGFFFIRENRSNVNIPS